MNLFSENNRCRRTQYGCKKLALTIADSIKSSRSLILKIIIRHLSSEGRGAPERKAIFDNLAKCFVAKTEIPHEEKRKFKNF